MGEKCLPRGMFNTDRPKGTRMVSVWGEVVVRQCGCPVEEGGQPLPRQWLDAATQQCKAAGMVRETGRDRPLLSLAHVR